MDKIRKTLIRLNGECDWGLGQCMSWRVNVRFGVGKVVLLHIAALEQEKASHVYKIAKMNRCRRKREFHATCTMYYVQFAHHFEPFPYQLGPTLPPRKPCQYKCLSTQSM